MSFAAVAVASTACAVVAVANDAVVMCVLIEVIYVLSWIGGVPEPVVSRHSRRDVALLQIPPRVLCGWIVQQLQMVIKSGACANFFDPVQRSVAESTSFAERDCSGGCRDYLTLLYSS